jgi:hypothetical protein
MRKCFFANFEGLLCAYVVALAIGYRRIGLPEVVLMKMRRSRSTAKFVPVHLSFVQGKVSENQVLNYCLNGIIDTETHELRCFISEIQ